MIFMFTFLLLVNLVREGKYEFNILPSVCIFSDASNSGSLISSGYLLNASVNTCKLFVNLDDFGQILDRNQVQLQPFEFVCQYVIDFHVLNIMSILAQTLLFYALQIWGTIWYGMYVLTYYVLEVTCPVDFW